MNDEIKKAARMVAFSTPTHPEESWARAMLKDAQKQINNATGIASAELGQPSEPLTLAKLQDLTERYQQTIVVNKNTDLAKRLKLVDRAALMLTATPAKSLHGIPIRTNPVIPTDVVAFKVGDKFVKIIALTPEAEPAAKALVKVVEKLQEADQCNP